MSDKKQPAHTMLYKEREDGEPNEHAWNMPLDHKVVEDSEIEAHQAEGWKTAAEIHGADKPKPHGRKPHQ
jgi:hypothetical protein